jgi:drug/metabolite transporter (DMT)-like permease
MTEQRVPAGASRWHVVAALAAVYVVWGSTYLAIHFAIETLPPFLMGGVRFFVAGGALYAWARLRGAPRPTRRHWASAAVVGGLLLLGGNGGVAWAEQLIPSGTAALLVSTVPLWMALLDWLRPGGIRPRLAVICGLVLGFVGVAVLVGPGALRAGAGHVAPLGAAVVLVAAFCWATGSIYSRTANMPASPLLSTGLEMLAGGAMMVVAGLALGEGAQFNLAHISARSGLALGYLIVFGSLVAFTAYIWLLRSTTTAVASTYAYVNPVVAVFLGWAFASEPLTARTLVAAAIIVAGVLVITTAQARVRSHSVRAALLSASADAITEVSAPRA